MQLVSNPILQTYDPQAFQGIVLSFEIEKILKETAKISEANKLDNYEVIQHTIKEFEKRKSNAVEEAIISLCIARIYSEKDSLKQLEYLNKSEKGFRDLGLYRWECFTRLEKSYVYLKDYEKTKALEETQQSSLRAVSKGDLLLEAYSTTMQVEILLTTKSWTEAEEPLRRACKLWKSLEVEEMEGMCYLNLAFLYKSWGQRVRFLLAWDAATRILEPDYLESIRQKIFKSQNLQIAIDFESGLQELSFFRSKILLR
jgi:hypothetical protein